MTLHCTAHTKNKQQNISKWTKEFNIKWKWKWKSLSCIWFFETPGTIQSMEFSRPEYWSGELFPSPGDLPNSGIELRSLTLQVDSLPAEKQGKPQILEWVAYPFSRGPSQPRNQTGVSWVAGGYPYCGILFSLIKEWDSDTCYHMNEI